MFNSLLGIDPKAVDTSKFLRYNNDLVQALKVDTTRDKIHHISKMVNERTCAFMAGNEIDFLVITGKKDLISNYLSSRLWLYSLDYMKAQATEDKLLEVEDEEKNQGCSIFKQNYRKNGRVYYSEIEEAGHVITRDQTSIVSALVEGFISGKL